MLWTQSASSIAAWFFSLAAGPIITPSHTKASHLRLRKAARFKKLNIRHRRSQGSAILLLWLMARSSALHLTLSFETWFLPGALSGTLEVNWNELGIAAENQLAAAASQLQFLAA